MSELTLERAVEEPVKENAVWAGEVAKTVFSAAAKTNPHEADNRDSLGELVGLAVKVRLNKASRQLLRNFGPKRFQLI